MKYKRLFYSWLQKEKIYHKFFYNVLTCGGISYESSSGKHIFERMVKILNHGPESYVSAFIWEDSFCGYSYWVTKHRKWKDYLSQWIQTH